MQTCTPVCDAIKTRHFWLAKLNNLDQACSPNLPPYIDPYSLSYSELRDVVVRAERTYYRLAKSPSGTAEYKIVKTINLEHPNDMEIENRRASLVELVPGSRFLFILYRGSRNPRGHYCELCLLDLDSGNKVIWSSDLSEAAGRIWDTFPVESAMLGCELHPNLSLTVAFTLGNPFATHQQ